ncbi:MAG: DUF2975 domain-containing protein [Polaromonas sp.]
MTPTEPNPTMSPTGPHLQRLMRTSQWLIWACWVLIIALPPLYVWFWAVASPGQLASRINLPTDVIQSPLMVWQRVAGGCISAVPLVLMLTGLWQARRCFGLFAVGQVFTLQAVRALKRFASLAAASFVCGVLASSVLSVVLTIGNAPGARHLAVGLSTDQAFALFFAGVVWLMAAVIAQGLQLAEENANFV